MKKIKYLMLFAVITTMTITGINQASAANYGSYVTAQCNCSRDCGNKSVISNCYLGADQAKLEESNYKVVQKDGYYFWENNTVLTPMSPEHPDYSYHNDVYIIANDDGSYDINYCAIAYAHIDQCRNNLDVNLTEYLESLEPPTTGKEVYDYIVKNFSGSVVAKLDGTKINIGCGNGDYGHIDLSKLIDGADSDEHGGCPRSDGYDFYSKDPLPMKKASGYGDNTNHCTFIEKYIGGGTTTSFPCGPSYIKEYKTGWSDCEIDEDSIKITGTGTVSYKCRQTSKLEEVKGYKGIKLVTYKCVEPSDKCRYAEINEAINIGGDKSGTGPEGWENIKRDCTKIECELITETACMINKSEEFKDAEKPTNVKEGEKSIANIQVNYEIIGGEVVYKSCNDNEECTNGDELKKEGKIPEEEEKKITDFLLKNGDNGEHEGCPRKDGYDFYSKDPLPMKKASNYTDNTNKCILKDKDIGSAGTTLSVSCGPSYIREYETNRSECKIDEDSIEITGTGTANYECKQTSEFEEVKGYKGKKQIAYNCPTEPSKGCWYIEISEASFWSGANGGATLPKGRDAVREACKKLDCELITETACMVNKDQKFEDATKPAKSSEEATIKGKINFTTSSSGGVTIRTNTYELKGTGTTLEEAWEKKIKEFLETGKVSETGSGCPLKIDGKTYEISSSASYSAGLTEVDGFTWPSLEKSADYVDNTENCNYANSVSSTGSVHDFTASCGKKYSSYEVKRSDCVVVSQRDDGTFQCRQTVESMKEDTGYTGVKKIKLTCDSGFTGNKSDIKKYNCKLLSETACMESDEFEDEDNPNVSTGTSVIKNKKVESITGNSAVISGDKLEGEGTTVVGLNVKKLLGLETKSTTTTRTHTIEGDEDEDDITLTCYMIQHADPCIVPSGANWSSDGKIKCNQKVWTEYKGDTDSSECMSKLPSGENGIKEVIITAGEIKDITTSALYANNKNESSGNFQVSAPTLLSAKIDWREIGDFKDITVDDNISGIKADLIAGTGQDAINKANIKITGFDARFGVAVTENNFKVDISGITAYAPVKTNSGKLAINIGSTKLTQTVALDFKKPYTGKIEMYNTNYTSEEDKWTGIPVVGTLSSYRVVPISHDERNLNLGWLNLNSHKYSLNDFGGAISSGVGTIDVEEVKVNTEASALSNTKGTEFQVRLNTNKNADGKVPRASLQIAYPVISYTLDGVKVRYYLTAGEDAEDKTVLSLGGEEFIGVRVIGAIQASPNAEFTGTEANFSSLSSADVRATIRKNAYTFVSSMEEGKTVSGVHYKKGDEGDVKISDILNRADISQIKTLVVESGNLIIDKEEVLNPDKLFGIIVLQDNYAVENGYNGKGNVYIMPNVKRIDAIIYADGGLISVDKNGKVYEKDSTTRTKDLSTQLIMNGSLFTRNTIGGAVSNKDNAGKFTLPGSSYTEKFDVAMQYDLNYVRRGKYECGTFDGDECYEEPFIIKYDSRIQTNPLELFKY